jgi:hypothetical protein
MAQQFRRPKRAPTQRSHLERLVDAWARERGLAPVRVRRWISSLALLGALDRVREADGESRFLVKGGVAMELRLGLGARATQDIDIVFRGDPEQLIDALDDAFDEAYAGFTFQRGELTAIRDTGARRFEVKLSFGGRSWQTLKVEGAPPEAGAAEPELVPSAISIADFGLDGPERVACLSLRYQIAQKLHAVTERFPGDENDRFRDLIDLLLLRDLVEDLTAVYEACVAVFEARDKQRWPPELTVPKSWADSYTKLSQEIAFEVTNVDQAAAEVRAFIVEITSAGLPQEPRSA